MGGESHGRLRDAKKRGSFLRYSKTGVSPERKRKGKPGSSIFLTGKKRRMTFPGDRVGKRRKIKLCPRLAAKGRKREGTNDSFWKEKIEREKT